MINSKTTAYIYTIALLLIVNSLHAQDLEHIDTKHPVKLSGTLNLSLETYSANGIENRKQPFTWILSGNPTLNIYGVELPFTFLVGNFENKYYQPFNQFGVSPYYKWIRVHLGYRNVQFSPFTLGGYRMLGGGVELTPGHFRFGFMYGRLNRSTQADSAQNANPLAYRPLPTYTRLAYAFKIGVGTEKNYFDISYLKGWDVPGSLSKEIQDTVAAASNAALGLSWKVTIRKKIVWQTDVGLSIYTNDINNPSLLDSITFAGKDVLSSIVTPNISTQYLTAAETKLGYQDRKISVFLVYKRIDPDYKSMGAYFFQNDVEQYTISPSLRLDSGRLFISGSFGTQHDNLNGLKLATSNRVIGSANISYNPTQKYGLNFNYSNYGITQNPLRTSPTSDIFKQVSQNFTIVPYVNLIDEKTAQNFQLVASYMMLNNTSQGLNTTANQNTLVGSFLYSRTLLEKGITGNVSLNYNNTKLPQGDIGSFGLGCGASVPVWEKKITVTGNFNYSSNVYDGASNGNTINIDAGAAMPIKDRHNLQIQLIYLKNQSKDETIIQTFSELTCRVVYGFRL